MNYNCLNKNNNILISRFKIQKTRVSVDFFAPLFGAYGCLCELLNAPWILQEWLWMLLNAFWELLKFWPHKITLYQSSRLHLVGAFLKSIFTFNTTYLNCKAFRTIWNTCEILILIRMIIKVNKNFFKNTLILNFQKTWKISSRGSASHQIQSCFCSS